MVTKAKDQIRPELKRLDPEIMLELTDIWFQNDYSTLVLCASGKYLKAYKEPYDASLWTCKQGM